MAASVAVSVRPRAPSSALTQARSATDELIASLDAAIGSHLTVLQWDCDHMVGQAKPAEAAAVVREHLERR